MNFLEVDIEIDPDFAEIIIAELAEIGFDSFLETDKGVLGYVEEGNFNDADFKQLMETYAARTSLIYSLKGIQKQNWNEEWEKNFEPIEINDQIIVRSTFHQAQPKYKYEIIITPKMSFGTGHHETTAQVMDLQLSLDHQQKKVLDVGTGTGILAILAEKLGATYIRAFDIDEWSVENTIENTALNTCNCIEVAQGTIQDEKINDYDIVLANINRNILIAEIGIYAKFLKPKGHLIISGFYEKDIEDITSEAALNNLKKMKSTSKKEWAAVVFTKI